MGFDSLGRMVYVCMFQSLTESLKQAAFEVDDFTDY